MAPGPQPQGNHDDREPADVAAALNASDKVGKGTEEQHISRGDSNA